VKAERERAAAVWRAWLAAGQRREAIGHLAADAAELGVTPRCPHCRMPVSVGARVSIRHRLGCPRRDAASLARRIARAGGHALGRARPLRPPMAAAAAPPRVEPSPSHAPAGAEAGASARHQDRCRDLRRHCGRDAQRTTRPACYSHYRDGERARSGGWYISGARVWAWVVCDWVLGTARRLVRAGRDLQAVIVLDGGTQPCRFGLAELEAA
jgi:hypothetical protein